MFLCFVYAFMHNDKEYVYYKEDTEAQKASASFLNTTKKIKRYISTFLCLNSSYKTYFSKHILFTQSGTDWQHKEIKR